MTDYRPPDGEADITALFDLSFKRFVTVNVIKVVYVIGIVVIALLWLIAVIGGFTQGAGQGIVMLLIASIIAALYLLFWRIWLELIVVVFRIADNTSIIVQQLGGGRTGGFPVMPPSAPPSAPPPAPPAAQ